MGRYAATERQDASVARLSLAVEALLDDIDRQRLLRGSEVGPTHGGGENQSNDDGDRNEEPHRQIASSLPLASLDDRRTQLVDLCPLIRDT